MTTKASKKELNGTCPETGFLAAIQNLTRLIVTRKDLM